MLPKYLAAGLVFISLAIAEVRADLVALEEGGEWSVEQIQATGQISTLASADAVLAGTQPAQFRREGRWRFLDFRDGAPMGLFGVDQPFLDGPSNDDFVLRARGTIRMLRPGQVTFAVGSDDGFRFRVDGLDLGTIGNRGFGYTTMVTNLSEGPHDVEVVMWERAGAAGLEVLVSRETGLFTTVDAQRFRLLPAAPAFRLADDREPTRIRPGGTWDVRERRRNNGPTVLETLDAAAALFDATDGVAESVLDPQPRSLDLWRVGDQGTQPGDHPYPAAASDSEASAVRATARVYVETSGLHTFAIQSAPKARLRIDGRLVVENGVGQAAIYRRALSPEQIQAHLREFDRVRPGGVALGTIELTAGWHDVEVLHLTQPDAAGLEVLVGRSLGRIESFEPERFRLLEASLPDPTGPGLTFKVTNTNSTGAGSLERAVLDLNATPPDLRQHAIDLREIRGRIVLSRALPPLERSVQVIGPGEHLLEISGGHSNRVFWVRTGTFEFRDLKLSEGLATPTTPAGPGAGGAAGMGGAIFVDSGAHVFADRITLERNRAVGGPGGFVSTLSGPGGSAFGAAPGRSGISGASATVNGTDGSGLNGINGRGGGSGNHGQVGGSGRSGLDTGAGGGAGANGGTATRGGNGSRGRNASANRNFLGTFESWNVAGDGGPGGRGGNGAAAGDAGDGGFGGGGGGGGYGGAGGQGGNGGSGGNGDSTTQFPVGTLSTPAGDPGLAGPGGNGGANGRGGNGGFGGGGGRSGAGGSAGANGTGRPNNTVGIPGVNAAGGLPGAFGGVANDHGGGAGAGLGGAIFVREGGSLVLGRTRFIANEALGGIPQIVDANLTAGEAGQGKGGAVFAMDGAQVILQRYPECVGNLASHGYGVSGDNGAFFNLLDPAIDLPALATSRQALYYLDAPAAQRDKAALRYVDLLYKDVGTPRPVFSDMGTWYGDPEREVLKQEIARAWEKARAYPASREWRDHLLDLYFHRAMAEGILGDNIVGIADEGRILSPPPGTQNFVIKDEIARFTSAVTQYERAVNGWFELLARPEGVESFRSAVQGREIHSATYLDVLNNLPRRVSPEFPSPGMTGYRDLILAFDLLSDFGGTAVELAEMLIGDEGPGNEATQQKIAHWVRSLKLRGELLMAMFPGLEPDDDHTPGLAVAMAEWRDALAHLASLQHTARGESNLLGFSEDFLLLLPRDSFDETAPFDSFDRFKLLLDPADASGRLGFALSALRDAESEYQNYQEQRFEFESQREALVDQYRERLEELGDQDTQGSLIAQQILSIELAKTQIRRNRVQIDNLNEEVRIEVRRNATEKQINLDIQDVKLEYGKRAASLDLAIAIIEGTQKAADNFADSASLDFGFGAKLANGVYQYAAEYGKGLIRVEQSRLAGEEEVKITQKENERLDANSAALIRTRLLEMRTLSVDSQTAALVLSQEMGRLVALQEKRRELLCRLESVDRKLNSRYFADPGHRLRAQRTTVLANQLFEDVQPWLYFMVRALEYKFNQPFRQTHAGREWTRASLFQCRNTRELELFWQAMRNYDQDEMLNRSGLKDRYDWFSVREDFFGYRIGTNDDGQPLRYADPITGASVDAITAFRSRMRQLMDSRGRVTLPFSTVREIPLPVGTFFLGPEFLASGTVDPSRKGLYLDKIKWMKIRLPGAHTTTGNTLVGTLAYGGTSFIRNAQVGTLNPERPDEISQELTAYGSRVWRRNSQGRWILEEQPETAIVVMVKEGGVRPDGRPASDGQEPDVLQSASRIDHFGERSVAASNWSLVFDTERPNPVNQNDKALRLDQLDDVEIYFYHYTANRN